MTNDPQAGLALGDRFDALLFDLDGVVYIGADPVPHAIETITTLASTCAFVTNNANRPPEVVAAHLRRLGLAATRADVITSPQAAVSLLPGLVPDGAAVLVVGGPGIDDALVESGYMPVHDHKGNPAAVMQGFSPELTWRDLAAACYAVESGLPWIATNPDRTIPTADGIAPGNGAFVDLVAQIAGRRPDAVAGKPEPPLLRAAISRLGAQRPLMVGDRLDTDIAAGVRAEIPSLLVLTGVTDVAGLLTATADERPDFVGADLRALRQPYPRLVDEGDAVTCGPVRACVTGDRLHIDGCGPLGQVAHAVAVLAWNALDSGRRPDLTAWIAAITRAAQPSTVDRA